MGLDLTRRRPWRTLGASVAGTAHGVAGASCADAWASRVFARGNGSSLLVAVAADGAGTSEHAAQGARLACEAVLEASSRWRRGGSSGRGRGSRRRVATFGRGDAVDFVEAARRRIAEAAARGKGRPRDYSCTLLVTLVDDEAAAFFQIGDGAIVYRDRKGSYRPALWPQTGEYANCTWFVTDADAADRVELAVDEGVDEVALFTDGLQGLALRFASREAHVPFFEPLFAHLRQASSTARTLPQKLRAFLDSPAVNQRTDDDKTLLLATRLRSKRVEPRPRRRARPRP